ncbi:hypothetical protein BX666DRAFT_1216240 [Dichotomocladium elegans]|nr:hypothetical protein BX666DRAFT_1216240 [Dichotomocladium elegans]
MYHHASITQEQKQIVRHHLRSTVDRLDFFISSVDIVISLCKCGKQLRRTAIPSNCRLTALEEHVRAIPLLDGTGPASIRYSFLKESRINLLILGGGYILDKKSTWICGRLGWSPAHVENNRDLWYLFLPRSLMNAQQKRLLCWIRSNRIMFYIVIGSPHFNLSLTDPPPMGGDRIIIEKENGGFSFRTGTSLGCVVQKNEILFPR